MGILLAAKLKQVRCDKFFNEVELLPWDLLVRDTKLLVGCGRYVAKRDNKGRGTVSVEGSARFEKHQFKHSRLFLNGTRNSLTIKNFSDARFMFVPTRPLLSGPSRGM